MRSRRRLAWMAVAGLASGIVVPRESANALDCGLLEEIVVEHPSGMRDEYCAVARGIGKPIPHGTWVTYDENGVVRLKGTNDSGRREGVWRSWHADGKLSGESTFVRGGREGRFRLWHENGQLKSQGTIAGGAYEGTFTSWNDAGIKVSEVQYAGGKKHGSYATWYDDGAPKQLGEFKEGKEHGHWISWHRTGVKLSEGDAEEGLRTGHWEFWARNGELRIAGGYSGRQFAHDPGFERRAGAAPEEISSAPPASGILRDVDVTQTGGEL